MPKRSSNREDANQTAHRTLLEAIGGQPKTPPVPPNPDPNQGKNPAAVELGKLRGMKGGPARAASLSKKQRSSIAKAAAKARWAKRGSKAP